MADFKDEFNKIMDTPDTTGEYDTQDINTNKVWAIFACFGIFFWMPLVAAPNSHFAKFYANQGLIYLVACIVLTVAAKILDFIPFIGSVIGWVVGILELAYLVYNIVNAASGKAKEMPLIGGMIKAFK